MTGKRSSYITWDKYLMRVTLLSGRRSKDPNTQVGACIINQGNKTLLMGYNGFPRGCSDDGFPWGGKTEQEDLYNSKYFYSTHSELSAILNYRRGSLKGNKPYVTFFPRNEYAKATIQARTRTVVSKEDKYADTPAIRAPKRILNTVEVRYYQYQPTDRKIETEA